MKLRFRRRGISISRDILSLDLCFFVGTTPPHTRWLLYKGKIFGFMMTGKREYSIQHARVNNLETLTTVPIYVNARRRYDGSDYNLCRSILMKECRRWYPFDVVCLLLESHWDRQRSRYK